MSSAFTEVIRKFNQNHDEKGRFCSGDGSSSKTYGTPKKAGKTVGWRNAFSKCKTVDDVVNVLDEYMPGIMELAKKVCEKQMSDRSYDGREVFAEACKLRGDSKPNTVSHDAFEKLMSDGHSEYFTDYANADVNELGVSDFVLGKTHKGFEEQFGYGTYARKSEQRLSDDARFTLDKKAVIGDNYDIQSDREKFSSTLSKTMDKVDASSEDKNALGEGRYNDSKSFLISSVVAEDLASDDGIYATLRGYDALIPGKDVSSDLLVVLNRSKVTIDEASIS